jgi:hypothetical protein
MEKEEKELLQDVAVKKAAEEARKLYKKVGGDLEQGRKKRKELFEELYM